MWYEKVSFFKKRGFFIFDFFGDVNGTAPHHSPVGLSLPPSGSLGARQTIFASLCASTMRQGEALGQGIKKNKSSCGKMPQDDFAVLLYEV